MSELSPISTVSYQDTLRSGKVGVGGRGGIVKVVKTQYL